MNLLIEKGKKEKKNKMKGKNRNKKIKKRLYDQFSPVSTCLYTKYIKFCFQNIRNVREDKNGRRWITFGFNDEKKMWDFLLKLNFFSYLRPSSSSLPFPKFYVL